MNPLSKQSAFWLVVVAFAVGGETLVQAAAQTNAAISKPPAKVEDLFPELRSGSSLLPKTVGMAKSGDKLSPLQPIKDNALGLGDLSVRFVYFLCQART